MKNACILGFLILLFTEINLAQSTKNYPKADISFLVIGDFGRHGEYNQKEVAKQMAITGTEADIDFIITTGDNIYPKGVASPLDPAWKSSFEDIYVGHSLHVNWYPVLGNHDYAGNPQAEIDYSQISRRWNMPARYYSKTYKLSDGSQLLIAFLDTSPFELGYYQDEDEPFRTQVASQDTSAQKKWFSDLMTSSKAQWKIAVGHHPLVTSGPRMDRKNHVANSWQSLLEKVGVDFYLAGHEHHLEYNQLSTKLNHLISGAGSKITALKSTDKAKFAKSSNGFAAFFIQPKVLEFQFIDDKGNTIFSQQIKK
ncbi:metallophosphoesterase [Aquirufa ecclesiirivi]|uniref:metallophosphoesterase n=1 Tax=Aquirufa ecclesiirivi TaxID=2715124 RepID=UPI0022A83E25|nr:metallophosphoesterase [Aquirufa ecclesiirivi]MCZ2472335.1 acid phosphatase [Aquirufa ecclesiirivi]